MINRIWTRIKERPVSSGLIGLILIVLILMLTGTFSRGAVAEQNGEFQTQVLQRGTLTATVGATGTLRANQSANLVWQTTGIVESVDVQVGDLLAAETEMARLVNTSLPQNVILAQSDLEAAEESLEAFYDSYADLGIAEAAKTLAEAQDSLEAAERNYNYVSTVARQVDIDQAFSNLVFAEDQLDKAKDDYEPYGSKPESNLTRASLLGKLATAQMNYDSAVRIYNIYTTPGTSTEIALAEAEMELASLNLDEAQENYDEAIAGPSALDILAAEARVTAALATLSQAFISAPFSGTVTDSYPIDGDLVSAGQTAFRLDDLSRYLVDVEVSEVDIVLIAEGQKAVLTFDAVSEREYSGQVVDVALAGTTEQGSVNFRVTVELLDADENVRPGMTAGVVLTVTELDGVLIVPNRAVRIVDGKRVIYLQNGSELRVEEIQLGASSVSSSQILNEELEGETVVLNPPTDFFGGDGGGGGPFGGGNGGGFQ
jgi:HlyD family secretion protein